MNCDTAFELMTDVSGSRSSALTRHLEICPRCRQMQETLAPALEFLSVAPPHELVAGLADDRESESSGRQPFVTVEAMTIANQAAWNLVEATAPQQLRIRRLGGRIVRYAAVFAAGLLLAVVATPQRDSGTIRKRECSRSEAAGSTRRSPEQIQILLRSCAACHSPAPAIEDNRTTSVQFRWFAPTDRLLMIDSVRAQPAPTDAPAGTEWIVVDSADRAGMCGPRV